MKYNLDGRLFCTLVKKWSCEGTVQLQRKNCCVPSSVVLKLVPDWREREGENFTVNIMMECVRVLFFDRIISLMTHYSYNSRGLMLNLLGNGMKP